MGLDLSKLENVKRAAHGKATARCPACAATGGDEKGNHLVIYSDGKYGCAANSGDKAHQREIFAMAGGLVGAGAPTKISVETFQIKTPYVVMDLGRFGRFSTAATQKPPQSQKVPPVDVPPPSPVVTEAEPHEESLPPSTAPSPKPERRPVPRPPLTVAGVCLAECCETTACAESATADSQKAGMSDEIAAFLAM